MGVVVRGWRGVGAEALEALQDLVDACERAQALGALLRGAGAHGDASHLVDACAPGQDPPPGQAPPLGVDPPGADLTVEEVVADLVRRVVRREEYLQDLPIWQVHLDRRAVHRDRDGLLHLDRVQVHDGELHETGMVAYEAHERIHWAGATVTVLMFHPGPPGVHGRAPAGDLYDVERYVVDDDGTELLVEARVLAADVDRRAGCDTLPAGPDPARGALERATGFGQEVLIGSIGGAPPVAASLVTACTAIGAADAWSQVVPVSAAGAVIDAAAKNLMQSVKDHAARAPHEITGHRDDHPRRVTLHCTLLELLATHLRLRDATHPRGHEAAAARQLMHDTQDVLDTADLPTEITTEIHRQIDRSCREARNYRRTGETPKDPEEISAMRTLAGRQEIIRIATTEAREKSS